MYIEETEVPGDKGKCWNCGEEVEHYWTLHFDNAPAPTTVREFGMGQPDLCEGCLQELLRKNIPYGN